MEKRLVTRDNMERIRCELPSDQGKKLESGCVTWRIIYQPANQVGHVTVWSTVDRAALWLGGDSIWGDYDPRTNTMTADNSECIFDLSDGSCIKESLGVDADEEEEET